MTDLATALKLAQQADDAFETAIKAAGYKSRWDWDKRRDQRPMPAYRAKVYFDSLVHCAFEESRQASQESIGANR